MILWLWQFKILEYCNNLSWCSITRTKTVTTTNDKRLTLVIVKCALNVKIQWLTFSSWLLSTVKNSNALNCSRKSLLKEVNREWTIQMNCNHTNLLTLLNKIVDSLACSFCSRTHQYDNVLSILCTIVVEQVIFTTCDRRDLTKVILNNSRNFIIVFVASLTVCEECLRILSSTACNRALWRQSTITETLDVSWINKRLDCFLVNLFNLMIFMRCTETVEEVDERNTCL